MQSFLNIVHGNVYGRFQYRPSMNNVLVRPYYRPRETSLVTAYILIVSDISQSLWVISGLIWSFGRGRSLWMNKRCTNFSLSYQSSCAFCLSKKKVINCLSKSPLFHFYLFQRTRHAFSSCHILFVLWAFAIPFGSIIQ